MPKLFNFNDKELKSFIKLMKVAPARVARSSASVLNDLAYKGKFITPSVVAKSMQVRDKNFLRRSVVYQKTNASAPLHSQQSSFGTIERERYTGLAEQEFGGRDTRKRIPTLNARRGSKSRKVSGAFRLKNKKIIRPRGARNETIAIHIAKRKREKSFLQLNHLRGPHGLYRFIGNDLKFIIKTSELHGKIARKPWMEKVRRELDKDNVMIASWRKALKREFKLKK